MTNVRLFVTLLFTVQAAFLLADGWTTWVESRRPRREAIRLAALVFAAGATYFLVQLALSTVVPDLRHPLLLLAQHPDVAERIAAEADRHADVPPDERMEALKYTRAVLAEAMRLYPPVWILGRTANTESRIGTHIVNAGSVIFLSQWVVHRDARWFERPLTFAPERFLDGLPHRQAYLPFGAGPRQCIGEGFAWMEGTLALASIARRWRLELMSEREPPLTARVTLRPATPVRIRVTTRSAAPR